MGFAMIESILNTYTHRSQGPGADRLSGLRQLFLLFFVLAGFAQAHAADKPLNFVFILADDLGHRDLGCYGSTFYETPHLDALAASGARFTSAYAACPVCSPTRSSVQSGKYPARTRNTDFFGGPQPEEARTMPRFVKQNRKLLPAEYLERLPLEEITIAEALKKAGYATFFAGKWHLGPKKGFWPEDQGYDENQGGNQSGHPKSYFSPYANPQLKDGPPVEHLDIRLANEAARFIKDHRDQPFFVCFCPYEVHTPLQTSDELKAKYEAKAGDFKNRKGRFGKEGDSPLRRVQDHAVYAGMVETMDTAVGQVLAALEENGVADRTVVFFTSDNGGLSTAEGSPTSNLPLRAGKGWLYEGGVRVPLLVRWPGHTKPGTVVDDYIISTDYYPTILDMAGVEPPPEQQLDGKRFTPLLQGEQTDFTRGPVYWHYPHYGNQGGRPGAAIRDGDWKLIEFFEDGRTELYNLRHDPQEKQDLIQAEPDRAADLLRQLHQWQQQVSAQFTTKNPDYQPQP
jgi:arylsulfatase A-like enzyme